MVLRIYSAPIAELLALKTKNVTSPNIRIALWQRDRKLDSRACTLRIMYENDLKGGSIWKKNDVFRYNANPCLKERKTTLMQASSVPPTAPALTPTPLEPPSYPSTQLSCTLRSDSGTRSAFALYTWPVIGSTLSVLRKILADRGF